MTIPFGARVVFWLQHLPFVLMMLLVVALLPALYILGTVFPPVQQALYRYVYVLKARLERINRHRAKLARMYGGRL